MLKEHESIKLAELYKMFGDATRLKILYAAQVSVAPPTIVLFVNDPKLLHFSYRRYLENRLREAFVFEGTPIRIIARLKE